LCIIAGHEHDRPVRHAGIVGHDFRADLIQRLHDTCELLVWLANIGSRSLGGLHAGQFVTTGSCTGTIFVKSAAQVTIEFQRLGAMTLAID
jgi:2-keto-4-pentenoate hydratase